MLLLHILRNVCLLCILVATNCNGYVAQFGRCTSPNTGLCVFLQDCPALLNMMRHFADLSNPEKQYLSSTQCGTDISQEVPERKVMVCCPEPKRERRMYLNQDLLPEPGVCGNNGLSNRIYGGSITSINEFPWMALIKYVKANTDFDFHCGGSLINTRYILTAAHCVSNAEVTYSVRLGEWDLKTVDDCHVGIHGARDCAPPHVDMPVEHVLLHELYIINSRNSLNDVALMRLTQNVVYSAFIRPICLPMTRELQESDFKDTVLDVAGWGKTENLQSSEVKLKTMVNVSDIGQCKGKYKRLGISLNNTLQLCAGGKKGTDTCTGDSGGPLMVMERINDADVFFIAGVVSFGPTPCGFPDWPGVYTRIGKYIDWITSKLQS